MVSQSVESDSQSSPTSLEVVCVSWLIWRCCVVLFWSFNLPGQLALLQFELFFYVRVLHGQSCNAVSKLKDWTG